jgi:hypothetical protein
VTQNGNTDQVYACPNPNVNTGVQQGPYETMEISQHNTTSAQAF